ncbi:MAG: lysophospholipid acyltransferase family protein [Sphingobacteriales bacterium]|jgi:1-acyl-sn-glycerol-3-phosphate acyltransferase
MTNFFSWWFRFKGWKIEEGIPTNIKKAVVIAAPHTSNWDFIYALGAYATKGLPIRYLAKKELFRFPFDYFFKATGGIPVERKKNKNQVDSIVELFGKSDELYLMMAAEGTRKWVNKWKSGFYVAALKAGVPIIMGYLDYQKKLAGFGDVLYPSGNIEQDIEKIKAFYKDISAKIPELFNVDAIRLENVNVK